MKKEYDFSKMKELKNPYAGKKLFNVNCANCHSLFGKGGAVGPDLT